MITIRRGESYPIYIELKQDGTILTPDMIKDLKICVGDNHWAFGTGGVRFDDQTQQWWIHPTQEQTLAMEEGQADVCAHIKYHDGSVYILRLDKIDVLPGCCGEVF